MTRSEPALSEAAPAERVVAVSVMKAGTHLIQELMVTLGYGIYGQTRVTPDIRPRLDTETRLRIASMVYEPEVVAKLQAGEESVFIEETDRAWEALAWSWQIKFGMPLENRYGREVIDTELVRRAHRRTAGSDFADTPTRTCWLFTEFIVERIDGHFLEEWTRTGEPRILFNYRDPRDVILSMVHFLSGETKRGYGNFSEFKIFNRILTSKSTLEERLTYALTDPAFPGYRAFENGLWLLNHPSVCKVSFEELVGGDGGGSAAAQRAAVGRICEFLGVDADHGKVADKLFNRDAFSFFKGQIGGWRKAFTAEHEKLFTDRFGHLLAPYGYA